jgi:hypothetical protein
MEHLHYFCYNMGHETPWIPGGAGEAPSTGHRVAERRQGHSFSCSAFGGSIQELRFSMVSRLPRGRVQGPSFEGDPGTASQVIMDRETRVSGAAFGGPSGRRLSDRSLDLEAGRSNHLQALSHPVSPESCVAVASGDGMELSETRAPGVTKGRQRDCPLEGLPVAAYKKRPKDVGPIWSCLMSRASCSFQTFGALGLRKGKPPSSITSTNRTGFPRSVPCRYPQSESGWLFIFGFGDGISPVWMFGLSSRGCSDISGDPWSCCGIGPPFTAERKLNSALSGIQESMWNTFRPMPPSLIRLNTFGTRLTEPCPTVLQRI